MSKNEMSKDSLEKMKDMLAGIPEQDETVVPLSMEKARAILITEQPFYACMLQSCRFTWDERVGTAGVRVNGRGQVELTVSPKFWNALPGYTGVGLLMHEMLHILNEHLSRGLTLEPRIANYAMDIAINQYIPEHWIPQGALMPEMKEPDTIHQKQPDGSVIEIPNPKAGQYIWKFEKGRSFEIYYGELMKLREKLKQQMKDQQTMDNHDWQEDGSQGDGQDGEKDENGQSKGKGKGQGQDGEEKEGQGSGQPSEEIQKLAYDALINKAVSDARERFPGSVPLHVEKAIMDRFKPSKIDWKREVRRFMGRKQSKDIESTRTRLNRRLGLNAPGYRKNYTPSILIAVDCSGSVNDEWYVSFMSEIKDILKGQEDKVEVIFFDYSICKFKLKISDLKEIPRRPASGGTCFQPVIDYANEKKPDLLIVFTDGDAPTPTKPSYPVMWALIGHNNGDALYGKKVKIDVKDLEKKK